jgi:DNA-binding Lrp family transcriptional regulator
MMMETKRQEIEQITKLLQKSPEKLWERIRTLLKEKGVDPDSIIVACSYLEDLCFEYGILVSEDAKVYQYGFDFLNKNISEGTFKEWEDITDTYHKLHYSKEIEIALQMVKERNK